MPKILNQKKENGVVYTPQWIVRLILDQIGYKNQIYSKKIIDPACGDGAFLTEIVNRLIKDALSANLSKAEIRRNLQKNVFGIDIDASAVKECSAILNKQIEEHGLKPIKWNILTEDSLNRDSIERFFGVFDFVVGNPPYIRIQNLGVERRIRIQKEWSLCQKGATDIFITFFEVGYSLLGPNGRLGYITPNTYLKTKAGEALREFISSRKMLNALIDFEHNQLFENATTYSVITVLGKTKKKNTFSLFKGDSENVIHIDEISLDKLGKNNWILTSNEAMKKLDKIEKRGTSLGKIAKIHVGITTLADEYYIFKNPVFDKKIATITLKDGRSFDVERNILKPIVKVSVLKDPNEDQRRFVIFPYKKVNNKNVIIPEMELKKEYPLTYKYFSEIKEILDQRDKGKPNPVTWYAFGRSQGLDTSFGKKILTSPINLKPNFIVWEKEEYTFYAGYCIKFKGNLKFLAKYLNSKEMEFYISHVSRNYQNNYRSYAKSFIKNFGISDSRIKTGALPL